MKRTIIYLAFAFALLAPARAQITPTLLTPAWLRLGAQSARLNADIFQRTADLFVDCGDIQSAAAYLFLAGMYSGRAAALEGLAEEIEGGFVITQVNRPPHASINSR